MAANKENWCHPNTVWFGHGRIKDLSKACKHLNIRKPLLVTDRDLAKSFNNEDEINQHIELITKEDLISNDNSRTLELKNWLNYLKTKTNG